MKTRTIYLNHNGILSIDEKTANIFSILLGSLFIAILAQISIPLPHSPVPITGQTIGVVLVGGLLGAQRGVLAVLCYLFEGAIGIPVFAQFKGGIHILIGPTGGYLWGFVLAVFLIGFLAEKGFTKNYLSSFISCLVSTTIILITGVLYLISFDLGIEKALTIGFYPFLIGDIVKSCVCTGLLIISRKI